jgi:hypothetical protein
MELTNEQIRLLIKHKWLLGSNGLKATERINKAWGEGTVDKTMVYKWFGKFDTCEEGLEDQSLAE